MPRMCARWNSAKLIGVALVATLSFLPPLAGVAEESSPVVVENVKVTPSEAVTPPAPAPKQVCTPVKEKSGTKTSSKTAKTKAADKKTATAKDKPSKTDKSTKADKKSKAGKAEAQPKMVCKLVAAPAPKPIQPVVGSNRIVLQFAKESSRHDINYRWFTLPNPNRVVVDFGDVSFKTPLNLVKLPEKSLVRGMRAGSFRPGTVRMVMDLEKASRINVFGIPGRGKGKDATGPRLVIDILGLRKGEEPTVVLPPADVVQAGHAPFVKPKLKPVRPPKLFPEETVHPEEDVSTSAPEQISATEVPTEQDAAQDKAAAEKAKAEAEARAKDEAANTPRDVGGKRTRALVVLDAGHGGVDPGACGKSLHLCEKNLTLDMVRKVRARLKDSGIDVILTRDSDVFIPLPERPRVAQKNNADLFVSLHADMHPTNRNVKGATVYMVSEKASDKEAARLMNSENDRDVMAGVTLADETPEVQNILMSLVQRDTLNNSVYLGKSILDDLGDFTEVRKHTLMSAGFRVLKSPDVPSVLVEMGYLSNATEERQLASEDYRDKLADTIAKGIKGYIKAHVHY